MFSTYISVFLPTTELGSVGDGRGIAMQRCKTNCEQVYNFERVLMKGKVISLQKVFDLWKRKVPSPLIIYHPRNNHHHMICKPDTKIIANQKATLTLSL